MEELMYYVWQQRLFSTIVTLDNTPIEIIHPGLRNLDAGPDFFNAKVAIDGIVWAGNVEMHVKASDWFKHNHQKDRAYDNVVLHVVLEADAIVERGSGEPILTVVMRIPPEVMKKYHELYCTQPFSFSAIRCATSIPQIPSVIITDWTNALVVQRMLAKAKRVQDLTEGGGESWQEAFYVMLCRSLGTGINSDACERLARALPYRFIQKHLDSPLQTKALILGQAGLLTPDDADMLREYEFLRAKFALTPLPPGVWKMAKLRPYAFPRHRLECLATILLSHPNLFSEIREADSLASLEKILYLPQHLGKQTVHSIIINAVVPVLMAYGQWEADNELCEKTLEMLESIPAESNRYMDYWIQAGLPIRNAFDSQALLHLYREYCEPHKCINCRLGCWIIKNRNTPST